ncbi:MAG: glycoside hydrolase family 127 protein [Lachnospiraceae bacterium]|nr:glycoside hydrolase family 127 protein [Lachnospiraceae bacterium]
MKFFKVFKKILAACLAMTMCVTSVPSEGLQSVWAATPTDREDTSIVYFVDCGDYVVDSTNQGEQLGTHNSVTEQVYGEDAVTGYKWGIVDVAEELEGSPANGAAPEGKGIATANTWALEQLAEANTDYPTADTFRYSKNFFEKGYEERYVDYAFELEAGTYEVTVGCSNRWGCADTPVITAKVGDTNTVLTDNFTIADGANGEVTGKVVVAEDGEMTVNVLGTGENNLCVCVSYITIKSVPEEESEDEAAVRKDKEALTITESTITDVTLPTEGANGSKITWTSANEAVISNSGKVTRPSDGKDVEVKLTATISSGEASDTKEFVVTVVAEKVPTPIDRANDDIIYFVDAGDYVVTTVSTGDQLGTHNSVTDQAYGEDPQTGYEWGIVDTISSPLKNGSSACGGVFTDNTWPYESNTANKDTTKTSSNRYTKNQFESGVQERYMDYKFEIENGRYSVTVCCTDPWACSQSPNVYLNYGKDSQVTLKEGLDASAKEVATEAVEVTDGELTVNLRATTDANKAINLCYIIISKYKELSDDEIAAEANKRVANDYAAIVIENTDVTDDLVLETKGENKSTITWKSSNEAVVSNKGKVTRPAAGKADEKVTLTATVEYNGYSMSKKFDIKVLAESDMSSLQEFTLADVDILDNYYNQVTEKDVEFLNTFDPDRLLYNFRLTAGYSAAQIKDGRFDFNEDGEYASKPYNGWENSRIGGHTLGHYIAAIAQASADGYGKVADDEGYTIDDRLNYIIDELADCQYKLGTGFIFGATMASQSDPERQFNTLEKGSTSDTWVPWYTMHKIINGLVETYKYTGNETALEVAESLGEWVYNRTSKWNSTTQSRVLGVEYGGMNDCLYELYKCARDTDYDDAEHFTTAAHWFDEDALFAKVLAGQKNALNGRHANCTIPKFVGALNRYRALYEEEDVDVYLEYAESFWELIVDQHTYITGGNSECEFFGADNILDAERSHCNCETCNTHNMLKLARELYRITGDKKYADYYETTFINAIMASVNENTGMTTYFQPMATGFFKVYCNPDLEKNYFWCCTGTGLENFTKLGDSFYFYSGNKLVVNQYTSSKVTWNANNIVVTQETDIPNTDTAKFTIGLLNGKTSADMDLRLRVPDWVVANPIVKVNGVAQSATTSNGYISINRSWKNGDVVELTLPLGIKSYTLPDNAGVVYGFKYGPLVLAAELGTDNKMDTYQIGVQCDVCKTKIVNGEERTSTSGYGSTSNQGTLNSETLNVTEDVSVAEFIENIEKYLVKDADSLSFTLTGTDWGGDEDLVFVPYYRINEERYGIYWLFAGADPAEIQQRILDAKKKGRDANVYLEGVGIGYGT